MMPPHPMIRRRLTALGLDRLELSAGTSTKKVVQRRESLVDQLIDDGQVAVLQALIDGKITLAMLDDYARESPLTGAGLAVLVRGQTTLAAAFDETVPKMAKGKTQADYALYLFHLCALVGGETMVRDLPTLDWAGIIAEESSDAAKHHMKRTVSRFLSLWYGKHHPARHAVMEAFPKLPGEEARVPDVTGDTFQSVLMAMRADLRPALVTLVVTGFRISEYLALTPDHLQHATHSIRVPGTKTAKSKATVTVDARLWPIIVASVPSPVRYRRFSTLWRQALVACGLDGDLRIHDLRHAHGQWAMDGGADERHVQRSLRHTTAGMTRRYTMSGDTRRISSVLHTAVAPALAALLTTTEDDR